jgi:glycosyltransferase involved in cell wall biosynthesis
MSPANVRFVVNHNTFFPQDRVEVAPNSIALSPERENMIVDKDGIRRKYEVPVDVPVFIYGGNLGKPQGIDFLMQCLDVNKLRRDCFFLIVGNGTEYAKLDRWYQQNKGNNVLLLQRLPKNDYDLLVRSCDVGMIFLDHRFTIPNYPSRLLDYLEYKMPIICATDPNTDIGEIAEDNGYGYWCESNSTDAFTAFVDKMLQSDLKKMGENGYRFLCDNYLVEHTYQAIMKHFEH